jgi:pimeloyl-ACP methyl ester carboxylesterase
MAYPMDSILEDISAEVANINVPTVLLAGELDQVDSIERHNTEVLTYLQNAEFKIIKGSGHLIPIDEPAQLGERDCKFHNAAGGIRKNFQRGAPKRQRSRECNSKTGMSRPAEETSDGCLR